MPSHGAWAHIPPIDHPDDRECWVWLQPGQEVRLKRRHDNLAAGPDGLLEAPVIAQAWCVVSANGEVEPPSLVVFEQPE